MDTTRVDDTEVGDVTQSTTIEDQGSKKQRRPVGRPPVTDHNINDEYVRDPPNVSTRIALASTVSLACDIYS